MQISVCHIQRVGFVLQFFYLFAVIFVYMVPCVVTLYEDPARCNSMQVYTGLFISSSGISELDCAITKTDRGERSISIGRDTLQKRKMAFTVNKKAFCVLEFAKTESVVTVQRRFRIMYHTEPPTDKTIREWYMNSSRVAACALRNEQAVRACSFRQGP